MVRRHAYVQFTGNNSKDAEMIEFRALRTKKNKFRFFTTDEYFTELHFTQSMFDMFKISDATRFISVVISEFPEHDGIPLVHQSGNSWRLKTKGLTLSYPTNERFLQMSDCLSMSVRPLFINIEGLRTPDNAWAHDLMEKDHQSVLPAGPAQQKALEQPASDEFGFPVDEVHFENIPNNLPEPRPKTYMGKPVIVEPQTDELGFPTE